MKSNHKFIDSPEFDEFFRRGDEFTHASDTIQPVVDATGHEEDLNDATLRTPAQRERRARFIKVVSATMAFFTIGSAGAFVYRASSGQQRSTVASYAARPPAESELRQTSSTPPLLEPPAQEPALAPAKTPIGAEVRARDDEATGPALLAPMPQKYAEPQPPASVASAPPASSATAKTQPAVSPSKVAAKTSVAPVAVAPVIRAPSAISSPVQGRSKSPPTRNDVTTAVGPKPAGYRPPTASFSD